MTTPRMYCEGLACRPWAILFAWGCRSIAVPSWPQLANRTVVLTHQARVGISVACRAWRIGPGDEVLAPAYNCGSEIDALLCSGAVVVFYRVDRHTAIDVQDIQRRVTSRTRAVYVTHYFGWPQELRDLAAWCRHRGILLFEDCALSLFSAGVEGPVGVVGDAAFFSFPKTLPTPDGGAWTLRAVPPLPQDFPRRPPLRRIVRKSLPLVKRYLVQMTAGLGCRSWIERLSLSGGTSDDHVQSDQRPEMPASYYYDQRASRWGVSRTTRGLLASFNVNEIVNRRRRNYLRLLGAVDGLFGVLPLFADLPDGVCPLGMPVLVEDRKWWFRMLTARQIGVYRWWEGYHRNFTWDGFEDARYLKDRLLVLPVHQDLSDAHIDYIAETVTALSSASAGNAASVSYTSGSS